MEIVIVVKVPFEALMNNEFAENVE